ncbi:MAG: hypothetical protein KDA98_15910 [Acidimicrobiales bacterium]|nr:hypothetical protein [Acidimicrobiales bacterium]
MSTSTEPGPPKEVDQPLGQTWTVGRVAMVVAFLAMALFWIVIWSGVLAKQNPDYLDDRAYVDGLEARCQQLRDDLDELPPPNETPELPDRIEVIEQANVLVEGFVDDVEAGAPTEGDDGTSMAGWIGDWRTYVADREDYVVRLREDPEARFLVDETDFGDSVDKTIEIFADVNGIPDCATPGDVG